MANMQRFKVMHQFFIETLTTVKRQAAQAALPFYIRYNPTYRKPPAGERYNPSGTVHPDYEEADALARAMNIPIKAYMFDPDEVFTEMEPTPIEPVEWQEWEGEGLSWPGTDEDRGLHE